MSWDQSIFNKKYLCCNTADIAPVTQWMAEIHASSMDGGSVAVFRSSCRTITSTILSGTCAVVCSDIPDRNISLNRWSCVIARPAVSKRTAYSHLIKHTLDDIEAHLLKQQIVEKFRVSNDGEMHCSLKDIVNNSGKGLIHFDEIQEMIGNFGLDTDAGFGQFLQHIACEKISVDIATYSQPLVIRQYGDVLSECFWTRWDIVNCLDLELYTVNHQMMRQQWEKYSKMMQVVGISIYFKYVFCSEVGRWIGKFKFSCLASLVINDIKKYIKHMMKVYDKSRFFFVVALSKCFDRLKRLATLDHIFEHECALFKNRQFSKLLNAIPESFEDVDRVEAIEAVYVVCAWRDIIKNLMFTECIFSFDHVHPYEEEEKKENQGSTCFSQEYKNRLHSIGCTLESIIEGDVERKTATFDMIKDVYQEDKMYQLDVDESIGGINWMSSFLNPKVPELIKGNPNDKTNQPLLTIIKTLNQKLYTVQKSIRKIVFSSEFGLSCFEQLSNHITSTLYSAFKTFDEHKCTPSECLFIIEESINEPSALLSDIIISYKMKNMALTKHVEDIKSCIFRKTFENENYQYNEVFYQKESEYTEMDETIHDIKVICQIYTSAISAEVNGSNRSMTQMDGLLDGYFWNKFWNLLEPFYQNNILINLLNRLIALFCIRQQSEYQITYKLISALYLEDRKNGHHNHNGIENKIRAQFAAALCQLALKKE